VFNAAYDMPRSYYAATAHGFAEAPILEGEIEADLVVIGGGVTGLSTALHAAERGFSVVLLEAGKIGWGASGRNGGQIIPGWRMGAEELIRTFGAGRAKELFALSWEAREVTVDLIAKHDIQCDLKTTGHLYAAARPGDVAAMQREVDLTRGALGYDGVCMLSKAETRDEIETDAYHGAILDEGGGHLHPLNYTLGLAEAARAAGVRLYEQSQVTKIDTAKGVIAHTAAGRAKARLGMLACDALLGHLDTQLAARIMPVANYVVALEPMGAGETLIKHDRAVADSLFVLHYFRMSADGRLIFSGGERYTPRPPEDIAAFVRPHLMQIFPQMKRFKIEHAWGGLVSVTTTRLPHIGRRGDLFFAHGYSGQGVLLSGFAGKVLAEAMAGHAEKFDTLASLAPPPFPGGAALRAPLYVLGMLYYALRDRL